MRASSKSGRDEPERAFRQELVLQLPPMRAFARALTLNAVEADDLVQEAMLRAWRSRADFEPGANFRAWLFKIVRNQFYSSKRKAWRWAPLDPQVAEQTLVAADDPSSGLSLEAVREAIGRLPPGQREALLLVGAAGVSYEEAAQICAVAIGTVKSRVSRARHALFQMLEPAGGSD
ncbi:MAG TPA: sigma-70 family RNA polymerase sigma factor [Caulobacteraceae bacterium]|nr:sigma-70 family RNA polymerase sigma factor [Caulobacteraceae bacterium]